MDRTNLNGCGPGTTVASDDDEGNANHSSILKCEICSFWCSDPRYIKLHREVDHRSKSHTNGSNKDDKDLAHPATKRPREDPAVDGLSFKNFEKNELKKSNVEEMIKITHSLLSQSSKKLWVL